MSIAEMTEKQARTYLEDLLWKGVPTCPHCGHRKATKVDGDSTRDGLYACSKCRKPFTVTVNTIMHRSKLPIKTWLMAFYMVCSSKKGISALQLQRQLGIGSYRTAWMLVNKIRKAMEVNPEFCKLFGYIEADETYFRESHKGDRHLDRKPRKRGGKASQRGLSKEQIPVLIARDRDGHTTDAVLDSANTEEISRVISPLIDNDVLLCSDGSRIYQAFAKMKNLTHKIINASAGEYIKEGAYHIQNVNAYDSRLKNWMRHFNGISTKYLESYLGWMRMLDRESDLTPQKVLAMSVHRINGVYT